MKRYHAGKGKRKRTVKTRIHKTTMDSRFRTAGKKLARDLAGLTKGHTPRKPKVPNIKRQLNKLVRSTKRANKKRA